MAMTKYNVLFLIIVYSLAMSITALIFNWDVHIIMPGQTSLSMELDVGGISAAWGVLRTVFAGLTPAGFIGVPLIVGWFMVLPNYVMILYFLYVNMPKIGGSGSPEP